MYGYSDSRPITRLLKELGIIAQDDTGKGKRNPITSNQFLDFQKRYGPPIKRD